MPICAPSLSLALAPSLALALALRRRGGARPTRQETIDSEDLFCPTALLVFE